MPYSGRTLIGRQGGDARFGCVERGWLLRTAACRGRLFEGWGRGRINARSATRGDDRQPTGRLLAFGTKCHPIPATDPAAKALGRGGPGMKTWAHKKSLCVRDAEANSERNSHSPPKVVACSWPSESAFAGQPAGSFPVRPDFLPARWIHVRTQAPSRSPGFLPLSPHHVKSTMKRGKSKIG